MRLNEYLIKNSMVDPLQSAYKDKLSTETALIKVQNDILSALNAGSSAIFADVGSLCHVQHNTSRYPAVPIV